MTDSSNEWNLAQPCRECEEYREHIEALEDTILQGRAAIHLLRAQLAAVLERALMRGEEGEA